MAYQSQLERFDIERGDVLSLSREDVVRLAEYWDITNPILAALFKWFLGGPDVPMSDPRDDMLLRGLKEHQRANAARRYEYLLGQRQRKQGKGKTTDNHGQPRTTTDASKEEAKEKISVSDKSSIRFDTPAAISASADGAGPLPIRPPEKDPITLYRDKSVTEAEFRENPVEILLAEVEEKNPDMARNTYRKYLKDLGPDVFLIKAWGFLKERAALYSQYMEAEANGERDAENAAWEKYNSHDGRILVARLKEAKTLAGVR